MAGKEQGFYQVFEVFSRKTLDAPMQHQFSLLAPNEEIALVMAQENFLRREPAVDLWVVKRDYIRRMSEEEKTALKRLDNKDYRLTRGYGDLKKRWRKYEQNVLDEKEILSWKGEIRR
ncbi:1,2-phenylacetyl-CoA epoxidase subunit PaaB [Geobacillus subterraneus]|uniref:1,2-phenylacetyl-CoA epoxidase subunit PaaB n=1 Tax=Geobacillus subterraneus TaxID=129338 RepID=UPI0016073A71